MRRRSLLCLRSGLFSRRRDRRHRRLDSQRRRDRIGRCIGCDRHRLLEPDLDRGRLQTRRAVTLLAPGSLYTASIPTSVLMVPKNSPAKTARDLNGKTLAVNGSKRSRNMLHSSGSTRTRRLDHGQVHRDDVSADRRVARREPDRCGDRRRPVHRASQGRRAHLADAYDAIGSRYIIGCWFTTNQWAAAHPDLATRFAQVIARTPSGPTRTNRRAATS